MYLWIFQRSAPYDGVRCSRLYVYPLCPQIFITRSQPEVRILELENTGSAVVRKVCPKTPAWYKHQWRVNDTRAASNASASSLIARYSCQPAIMNPVQPALNFKKSSLLGSVQSEYTYLCLLYTSPSPRDQRGSRMPSSA